MPRNVSAPPSNVIRVVHRTITTVLKASDVDLYITVQANRDGGGISLSVSGEAYSDVASTAVFDAATTAELIKALRAANK